MNIWRKIDSIIFMLLIVIIFLIFIKVCSAAEGMRYNVYEKRWEFAEKTDKLKYNYHNDDWSYQPEDAKLDYNVYEHRMEWRRKGKQCTK